MLKAENQISFTTTEKYQKIALKITLKTVKIKKNLFITTAITNQHLQKSKSKKKIITNVAFF